jgi:putative DNA primase/helicase
MNSPSIDNVNPELQEQSLKHFPDLWVADRFLSILSEGEPVTFQTFNDDKHRKDVKLARIFHGTLQQHGMALAQLNQQGAGVFVTVNETDFKGRTESNIVGVRGAFVDLDGAPLEPVLNAPLSPHIVVESSQGRYHAYWLIEKFPLEHFKIVQKALIARFQADDKVHDLPRVMRLPGFWHLKEEPFQTRIMETSGGLPYKFDEFIKSFDINLYASVDLQPKMGMSNNPILKALEARKMIMGQDRNSKGQWNIICPWVHEHTTGSGGTCYFEAHTNGYAGDGFKCFHDHCKERKIKDLINWLGVTAKSGGNQDSEWETPIALPNSLPPVMPLDPDILPEPLKGWIMDIAERMQIPPDFSAAASIVVLSSLTGRKVGIFPKRQDDWLVVPNLWGMVVGRPSLLKSPAIAEIMKPLDRLVVESLKKNQEDIKAFKRNEPILKAKKKALQDQIEKAVKRDDDTHQLLTQFEDLEESKQPILKRYKTEDGTVEKVGEILLENPNGILIHRDELFGWLKILEKEGREGDRQFYLEAWNGSGSFTYDRIGRGTLHIPALCLSILGGIQPGPLSSYVYSANKGGMGDDGLLQRFQLLVWPDAPKEWKNVDRWPDIQARERAYNIFRLLDNFSPIADVGDTEIPGLRFSSEAQEMFNEWRTQLELRIRSNHLSPSLESHLAKYRSLMPSLSLIFQLVEDLDLCKETLNVGLRATSLAVKWCDYLESHANRLYSSADSSYFESAKALLDRIKKGEIKDGFTQRDVYMHHWSKLSSPEEVQAAINVLCLHGWLKLQELKTSGRPKTLIRLHPKLRKEEKEKSNE